MKQTIVFPALLFLLFCSICAFKCVRTASEAPSVNPAALISFVDIQVGKNLEKTNLDRINSIAASVREKFLDGPNIIPFSLKIYPLYYSTGDADPVFSFDKYEKITKGVSRVEADNIRESFSPKTDYFKFRRQFLLDSTKTYKQIWPSVCRLKNVISRTAASNICVIYCSDFTEFRSPADPKESRFLFTERLSNDRLVLACDQIQAARQQLTDSTTVLGAAIADCRRAVKEAQSRQKHISVKLVKCHNDIKTDNCTGARPLEEYWLAFFEALGIAGEDIVWISETELGSELEN
ncbi:MAG: hypothetical protein KA165_17875 [Saprospiraceae bacterium]|nr:hypothetical protein [Saprospiraceae bacterium]